ncbi:hypothetical protein AB7B51_17425 [Acinetobacter baumannii]|uniref:hypothetical protein n=1 Tax=Acinetobacter baumannii TaxID=470 RepID=UPI0034E20234
MASSNAYTNGPASTESLAEVNKVVEASKGQPFEAEFKREIAPLVKDGITNSEAKDILRIYEDARIKANMKNDATK